MTASTRSPCSLSAGAGNRSVRGHLIYFGVSSAVVLVVPHSLSAVVHVTVFFFPSTFISGRGKMGVVIGGSENKNKFYS